MKTYLEVGFKKTGIEVRGYQARKETPDIIDRNYRIIRIWGMNGIVNASPIANDFETVEKTIKLYSDAIALYRAIAINEAFNQNDILSNTCYEIFHRKIGGMIGIVVEDISGFMSGIERFDWVAIQELEEDGIYRLLLRSYDDFAYRRILVVTKSWELIDLKKFSIKCE